MPGSSPRKIFAAILMFGATVMAQAQGIDTRWRLLVVDLKHEVKVEATIRFLGEPVTESCMGSSWKRAVIEAKTASDEKFFPLAEPLAYQIQGGELTLGRTAVCDGYLFLSGRSKGATIQGTYDAVGIGLVQKLGHFTLKRIP
ncbi:MAG: hypothetical protein H7274_07760 [Rhodoferax sp.]|nr:hypothetical protein [Rhodoferax sp.]